MAQLRIGLAGIGLLLFASACSASFSIGGKSPEAAAVEVIETQIAEQLGWELTADCPDLDDPQAGDTFTCTSDSPTGETIRYTVDIGDDEVNVNSTNLVTPSAVDELEAALLEAVRERTNVAFPRASVECSQEAIVIPDDGSTTCRFATPPGLESDLLVTDLDPDTGDFTVLTPAPELIASELINDALSEQLGIQLRASCPPPNTDVGSRTFECVGSSEGNPDVQVVAVVEDGGVDLNTRNVVRADALGLLEAAAADAIGSQLGAEVPAEAVDCGATTVVLGDDGVMSCRLTEPDGSTTALELFDIDTDTGEFRFRTV